MTLLLFFPQFPFPEPHRESTHTRVPPACVRACVRVRGSTHGLYDGLGVLTLAFPPPFPSPLTFSILRFLPRCPNGVSGILLLWWFPFLSLPPPPLVPRPHPHPHAYVHLARLFLTPSTPGPVRAPTRHLREAATTDSTLELVLVFFLFFSLFRSLSYLLF